MTGPKSGVYVALVLFTGDLRVYDNPTLAAAVRSSDLIVPLFVLDARILGGDYNRPNRATFLVDSLRDLDAALRARGAALVVRSGDVVEDGRVHALSPEVGEPSAARRRAHAARTADAEGSHRQHPGRVLALLGCTKPGRREALPGLGGVRAPAGLARLPPPGAGSPTRRDAPRLPLPGDRWHHSDEEVTAWRAGRTGYPIVDAGMRQLAREGWMHNRARLITAHFLTKTLYIDWRLGAAHFLDLLVDGDVANNTMNWQWCAGTGTDSRFNRSYNVTTQARRHDPRGAYVRRYVEELADVDDSYVHEPWLLPEGQLDRLGYPVPIVDQDEARERMKRVRGKG